MNQKDERRPNLVGIDATPLATAHAVRGIGRYLRGVIDALLNEQPAWCLEHLGVMSVANDPGLATLAARTRAIWTRRTSSIRPQDVEWVWAAISERAALRGVHPTLWHETDPGSPVSPLPMARTITTAYDLIPVHEPEVMARIRPHRRLVYRLYLRNLRHAGMVVAISETTAGDLTKTLGIPRDRIRVVYPVVVGLDRGGRHAAGTESEVRSSGRGPRFLFVGVPDPHKQPELAVAALARFRAAHRDGRLTFVGYQPEPLRRRLRDQAETLGVGSSVDFAGRVDDATLARMYESDILLSVSRREGFGLPPVEALLSGGRAVTVPGAIYDEVLGDAAVRAASDHAEAIAEAMLVACTAAPRPAAVDFLREKYSPRAAGIALRAAYDDALGQLGMGRHAGR